MMPRNRIKQLYLFLSLCCSSTVLFSAELEECKTLKKTGAADSLKVQPQKKTVNREVIHRDAVPAVESVTDIPKLRTFLEKSLTLALRDGTEVSLKEGYRVILGESFLPAADLLEQGIAPLCFANALLAKLLYENAKRLDPGTLMPSSSSSQRKVKFLTETEKVCFAFETALPHICKGMIFDDTAVDEARWHIISNLLVCYSNQATVGLDSRKKFKQKASKLREYCPVARRNEYSEKENKIREHVERAQKVISLEQSRVGASRLSLYAVAKKSKLNCIDLVNDTDLYLSPAHQILHFYQSLNGDLELLLALQAINRKQKIKTNPSSITKNIEVKIRDIKTKIKEIENAVRETTNAPLSTMEDLYAAYARVLNSEGINSSYLLYKSLFIFLHLAKAKKGEDTQESQAAADQSYVYYEALCRVSAGNPEALSALAFTGAFINNVRGNPEQLIALYAQEKAGVAERRSQIAQKAKQEIAARRAAREAVTTPPLLDKPVVIAVSAAKSAPAILNSFSAEDLLAEQRREKGDSRRNAAIQIAAEAARAESKAARRAVSVVADPANEGKDAVGPASAILPAIADIISLTTSAKKVDAQIINGTWQFTKAEFETYIKNLGFVVRSGGKHTKASLPDALLIERGNNLVSVVVTQFPNLPGALTLPNTSWDGTFVPYYLRGQIEIARQRLARLVEAIKPTT